MAHLFVSGLLPRTVWYVWFFSFEQELTSCLRQSLDIWAVLQNTNPDGVYWCEQAFRPSDYGHQLSH